MGLKYRCRCGGIIRPKASKIALMIGTHVLYSLHPPTLMQRVQLWRASNGMGTFLTCHACGREIEFSDLVK